MVSARQLAAAFGVTGRTVSDYLSRGCPTTSIKAARKWRQENIATHRPLTIGERKAGVKPRSDRMAKHELQLAKIRKLEVDTETLRLKNKATMANLYHAKDVDADVAELLGLIRGRLATVPAELAAACEVGPEWQATIQKRVTESVALIIKELDRWQPEYKEIQRPEDDDVEDRVQAVEEMLSEQEAVSA